MLLLLLLAQLQLPQMLDSALSYVGFTRRDISIRSDFSIPDPYRLSTVTRLYRQPLDAAAFVDSIALLTHTAEPDSYFPTLAGMLGIECRITARPEPSFPLLLTHLRLMHQQLQAVFREAPPGLARVFEKLTYFDPIPTETIEEEKQDEREADSLTVWLKNHAAAIDYPTLCRLAYETIQLVNAYQGQDLAGIKARRRAPGVRGEVLAYGRTDFGEYVVGGPTDNTYTGKYALIIDLGGNDTYDDIQCAAGSFSIIVDLDGDDVYRGGNYSFGSGYFGIGILIDHKGNDRYDAGNFSLGAGAFGVGLLVDREGHDRYFGDTFTQGAGGFGIGILADLAGNDIYHAAMYAQGFGKEYGVGLLSDRGGNDNYFAGGKYLDEIRYLDHYLSLSQGFSIGSRPEISGSFGILTDYRGNDTYVSDIFGQGSSYWYAIGGLVDYDGNDSYISYQYAQGCGTHVTIGVLIDKKGNDSYTSKGVSQGCGHDLSLGLLLDEQGDDSYSAFDLSQGAGNANGYGILVDLGGDDTYLVKREQNTQGYGDFRREYGSLGILLDLAGKDFFSHGVRSGLWKRGRYGLGMDWD